ncbi:MAG: NAD(P)H-dependent oxidoreductase subunit E [Verrucomicrobiae bacterium]|nr:NAD(P)H-dependent oxidoreductase subunit E [Verrucomicrobiae bacterium]
MKLPADFTARADEIIARYPASARSATLPLLHLWQETFGFVSGQGVEWIGARLGLEPIRILELVTFYPMFRQAPIGRRHIRVCRTLSCALAGARDLYAELCRRTGAAGDAHGPVTSPDGEYTIEFVECLASCGTAPVAMIGDRLIESANTPDNIEACLGKGD